MYYIYSFRSRNQSMRFFESLKRNGITAQIINTPRAVSVGCGLSVKVPPDRREAAAGVFSYSQYDTFIGLFAINGGEVRRIM